MGQKKIIREMKTTKYTKKEKMDGETRNGDGEFGIKYGNRNLTSETTKVATIRTTDMMEK